MNRPVAVLIGAGWMALSSCSSQPAPTTPGCATRFAGMQGFPAVTSGIAASYVFDGGERGKDAAFVKATASIEGVIGDGRTKIAEFHKREFGEKPSIMLVDGTSLIGIGKPVKDAADAVKQGCALEARYGTLSNIRLTAVNPTLSTKNER